MKKERVKYSGNLFIRNLLGLLVTLLVLFFIFYLVKGSSWLLALSEGAELAVLAAVAIAFMMMLLDKHYIYRMKGVSGHKFLEKLESDQMYAKKITRKTDQSAVVQSDLLFGDVAVKVEDDGVELRGSEYQVNRILKKIL